MTYRRAMVALGAATAVALTPGAASAATKRVLMGPPPDAQKSLQRMPADANDFFPNRVTINAGDKVAFTPAGFHSVDLPARGQTAVPFAVPTGRKATGVNDEAGAPFWFNGADVLGFNPLLTKVNFGKRATYTGNRRVNSGLPLTTGGPPKPFTVKFTKAGSYTYFCDLHPGMKGRVTVRSKGRTVPSARADRRAVRRQAAQAVRNARTASRATPPTGTVLVGAAGPRGVESYKFIPAATTVPVGTTLRFQISTGSYDAHTATTGPGTLDENDRTSYLATIARSFEGPSGFDPRATYPSERPASPPASLTPRLHGNGFWHSGLMDRSPVTPLPASGSVRFDQAGTYPFVCLIHPFMRATVTVR